jgi:hypothetical protein
MAKPKGRPIKFGQRLDIQIDEETKAWLSAVATAAGTTEAVVVRSILKTCREWAAGHSESTKSVEVAP